MNMSIKEAVRIASRWVSVEVVGKNRYRIAVWDTSKRIWYEGNEISREGALRQSWENKVWLALDLLGIKDATTIAHRLLRNYPEDWRHSVREGLRIAESGKLEA